MYGKFRLIAGLATAMLFSAQATATIVRFETNLGPFDVNLYDRGTPATVANFLSYVSSGAYANGVVHRSVAGFVVQGGGYRYVSPGTFANVVTSAPVTNQPLYSNVRGTIAMAKLSGSVNSATSQWFINTGNNSANLDVGNGGYTVFGQVMGNGMAIVDAINAVQTYNVDTGLESIPLRAYSAGMLVSDQHAVIITSAIILDPSLDTAAGITPTPNTLITQPPVVPVDPEGGGGATGAGSLLLLGMLILWRRSGIFPAGLVAIRRQLR